MHWSVALAVVASLVSTYASRHTVHAVLRGSGRHGVVDALATAGSACGEGYVVALLGIVLYAAGVGLRRHRVIDAALVLAAAGLLLCAGAEPEALARAAAAARGAPGRLERVPVPSFTGLCVGHGKWNHPVPVGVRATVDAVVPGDEFARFTRAACERTQEGKFDGMLGVVRWRGDRKPLFADIDEDGLIVGLGEKETAIVTAGIYWLSTALFRSRAPARARRPSAGGAVLGVVGEGGG